VAENGGFFRGLSRLPLKTLTLDAKPQCLRGCKSLNSFN
jgi:hypothetical protein